MKQTPGKGIRQEITCAGTAPKNGGNLWISGWAGTHDRRGDNTRGPFRWKDLKTYKVRERLVIELKTSQEVVLSLQPSGKNFRRVYLNSPPSHLPVAINECGIPRRTHRAG